MCTMDKMRSWVSVSTKGFNSYFFWGWTTGYLLLNPSWIHFLYSPNSQTIQSPMEITLLISHVLICLLNWEIHSIPKNFTWWYFLELSGRYFTTFGVELPFNEELHDWILSSIICTFGWSVLIRELLLERNYLSHHSHLCMVKFHKTRSACGCAMPFVDPPQTNKHKNSSRVTKVPLMVAMFNKTWGTYLPVCEHLCM